MKKAFIFLLLYYLILHFIIPELYYLFVGNVYIYSDLVDVQAAQKAFWLNTSIISITIVLLIVIPFKDYKIKPTLVSNTASHLFIFSIAYSFLYLFLSGGFAGIISGGMAGSLANYINFFLNPNVLLMCVVFTQQKRSYVILMILLYIVSVTLLGSRSGILGIFLIFFASYGFSGFDAYRHKIFTFLKYALIISPVLFFFATRLRGVDDAFELKFLFDQITGRVSFIELGMIPVHYVDKGGLDLSVLYAKYDIIHQFKLILDSILPGQIFERDVMPNNYFRSIFFGYSEDFVINNYMSINLTLPVYFYLYFGSFAIAVCTVFLILYYCLINAVKKHPFISIILISTVYETLVYFDWVMIFNRIYVAVLTIGVLKIYTIIYKALRAAIVNRKTIHLNVND